MCGGFVPSPFLKHAPPHGLCVYSADGEAVHVPYGSTLACSCAEKTLPRALEFVGPAHKFHCLSCAPGWCIVQRTPQGSQDAPRQADLEVIPTTAVSTYACYPATSTQFHVHRQVTESCPLVAPGCAQVDGGDNRSNPRTSRTSAPVARGPGEQDPRSSQAVPPRRRAVWRPVLTPGRLNTHAA